MRYRQTSTHPEPGTVDSLTIVPVLPDGTLGGLLPAVDDDGAPGGAQESGSGGAHPGAPGAPGTGDPAEVAGVPLTLLHGPVQGPDWQQAVRQMGADVGFHVEEVHVVAAEGLPEALHLIVWAVGEVQDEAGPDAARLHWLRPDELRRRVSPEIGMIPGGASAAWIVADVAATIARRN